MQKYTNETNADPYANTTVPQTARYNEIYDIVTVRLETIAVRLRAASVVCLITERRYVGRRTRFGHRGINADSLLVKNSQRTNARDR